MLLSFIFPESFCWKSWSSRSTLDLPFECLVSPAHLFLGCNLTLSRTHGMLNFSVSVATLPLSKRARLECCIFFLLKTQLWNTALKHSLSWYKALHWSYYVCNQQGHTCPATSWRTCCQASSQSLLFLAFPCLFGESYHRLENFLSIKYFLFENDA